RHPERAIFSSEGSPPWLIRILVRPVHADEIAEDQQAAEVGTMSAAVEGAIEGIPSIGFSLCDDSIDADFTASKKIAEIVALNVLKNGLPKDVCLNVNIPKSKYEELKGIRVCRQAKANWVEELDERKDPGGKTYFWLTGKFENYDAGKEDTDVWALENNYVSLVPVQFDMTAHSAIKELNTWKL
ncbi:MAG TPA: 5'/3'-nucleotidase SurE, partial [Bacteroidia bacterium]|nr:5'/3'-nucleotidase SurE [Bacteroidia bacterium]